MMHINAAFVIGAHINLLQEEPPAESVRQIHAHVEEDQLQDQIVVS